MGTNPFVGPQSMTSMCSGSDTLNRSDEQRYLLGDALRGTPGTGPKPTRRDLYEMADAVAVDLAVERAGLVRGRA